MKITLGEIEIEIDGVCSDIVISPGGKKISIRNPVLNAPVSPSVWNNPYPTFIGPGGTTPPDTSGPPSNVTVTYPNQTTWNSDRTETSDYVQPSFSGAIPNTTATSAVDPVCDREHREPIVKCEGRVRVDGIDGETWGARVYSAAPPPKKAAKAS
jgi:hypothetical protein